MQLLLYKLKKIKGQILEIIGVSLHVPTLQRNESYCKYLTRIVLQNTPSHESFPTSLRNNYSLHLMNDYIEAQRGQVPCLRQVRLRSADSKFPPFAAPTAWHAAIPQSECPAPSLSHVLVPVSSSLRPFQTTSHKITSLLIPATHFLSIHLFSSTVHTISDVLSIHLLSGL